MLFICNNLRKPARGGSTIAVILDFVVLWITGNKMSSAFPTKNSQLVISFLIAFCFASFIASGIISIPSTSPQCCNNEYYIYIIHLYLQNFIIMDHTFEKQRPMVPVPQHTSSNAVSIVGSARSITALYKTSAPNVLTWKNAWGETRNFIPSNISSIYSVPLTWYKVSLLSPPILLQD